MEIKVARHSARYLHRWRTGKYLALRSNSSNDNSDKRVNLKVSAQHTLLFIWGLLHHSIKTALIKVTYDF